MMQHTVAHRAGSTGPLIPVNDLSEIPAFADECEEAEFWSTHGFGQPLLDQMQPLDANREVAE